MLPVKGLAILTKGAGQLALVGVHIVHQAHQGLFVGRGGADGHAAGFLHHAGAAGGGGLVELAGQSRDAHEVLGVIADIGDRHHIGRGAAAVEAVQVLAGAVVDGGALDDEGFLLDQALAEGARHPLHVFLVGVGGVGQVNLAVRVGLQQVIDLRGMDAVGAHQHPLHGLVARGIQERDLVIGVAVAVGVLLLEGLEHFVQLVHGLGHFHAHVGQPLLVDEGAGEAVGLVQGDLRDGVDAAVRRGHIGLGRRVLLQIFVHVGGHIPVLVEVDQVALGAPLVGVQHVHARVAHDIGELVGGDHQGQLGLPVLSVVEIAGEVDAQFILEVLDHDHLGPVFQTGRQGTRHRHIDDLVADGVALGVVVAPLFGAGRGREAQQHRAGQNQGHQVLVLSHRIGLLFIYLNALRQ